MESLSFDVIVVGAGPAGLTTAWKLSQLQPGIRIAVLEKAARIGGHLLSGGLVDPEDLTLLGDLTAAPLGPTVTHESLRLLTTHHSLPLPTLWSHRGCRMLALGPFCRWLSQQCTSLGVELYPGFTAAHPLWEGHRLIGVTTPDQGRHANGVPKPGFQPAIALLAPITILAEGCRGHLTRQIIERLALDRNRPPQTFGLGFKELWEIPPNPQITGRVLHTLGHPLPQSIHGGGFVYGLAADRLAVGWVTALDYRTSAFDPFHGFQQWKHHPSIRRHLIDGRPLAFGARTLVEGGWQCLPDLVFDGGLIVGDGAGFLDAARLKGIGHAIRSGLAAAESVAEAMRRGDGSANNLHGYPERIRNAAWFDALRRVRNVRPGFRAGRWLGMGHALWERWSKGSAPWSWRWRVADRDRMQPVVTPIPPPATLPHTPWILTRSQALALAAVHHPEDQPCHLTERDPTQFTSHQAARFAHPETRFCPAGVFEVRLPPEVTQPTRRIHASHCLHCKCCDIKDPLDNLRWTPPEGGSGPDYGAM